MSLSVGLIFIFIGIPLWWNTTKVYRASLPYDEMEQLNQLKVRLLYYLKLNQERYTDILMSAEPFLPTPPPFLKGLHLTPPPTFLEISIYLPLIFPFITLKTLPLHLEFAILYVRVCIFLREGLGGSGKKQSPFLVFVTHRL